LLCAGEGPQEQIFAIADPADVNGPALRAFVKSAIAQTDRPDPKLDKHGTAGKSIVQAIYPKKRRPTHDELV
jgi:hypothetical protein